MQSDNHRKRLKLPGPLWCALFSILIVAICGALIVWLPRARALRLAEQLKDDGADVHLGLRGPEWFANQVDLFAVRTGDDFVFNLFKTRITDVLYVQSERRRPKWEMLEQIGELETLYVGGMLVSDADLERMRIALKLESLLLADTSVTANSIPFLTSFRELKYLGLNKCDFGDVAQAVDLPQLESLLLNGSNIGDSDLAYELLSIVVF